MTLNEKAVAEALYEDPNIRTRIASHYGINDVADAPVTFVDEVVEKLNQSPSPDPLRGVSNTEVFEAAVRALGSNSRPWATFLENEKRIYEALGGLDLTVARHTDPEQLATLLSGTTRRRDAAAITGWAKHLADLDDEQENYYDTVRELATWMKGDAATAGITDLPNEHLMLCLIGHLVDEQPKAGKDHMRKSSKACVLRSAASSSATSAGTDSNPIATSSGFSTTCHPNWLRSNGRSWTGSSR